MMTSRARLAITLFAGIALGAVGMEGLHAQQGGIKRTPLLKGDITGAPNTEVVMGLAEIGPGVSAGRHIHHGEEYGYVLEGTATLEAEGKTPMELKPGMAYHIGREIVHDAKVSAAGPAKVLAIYIVDKGKPLAEPAK